MHPFPAFALTAALLAFLQPGADRTAVNALLDTDRAFSAAAARLTAPDALVAMMAPDVRMQAPTGFVHGRDSVSAVLRLDPALRDGRVQWTPIRGGISADGTHGFTFGYLTLTRPDTAPRPMKYMAYWVRTRGAWRVAAYKRGAAGAGTPSPATLPPSLPGAWGAALPGAAAAARDIAAAEAAFSELAGRVGLGEAFRQMGAADAVNMGGASSPSFVTGPDSIARLVSRGEPPTGGSLLRWSSDHVLAAPSGDLGVSIGTIRAPAAGGERQIPFFTIWRRTATGPWRYIAE